MEDVIIRQDFAVGKDVLWKAITEHEQMIHWFFENIPSFKAEVGFTTQFLITNEGRSFTHLWEIIVVNPGYEIVYDWSYLEYPGKGIVSFKVSGTDIQSQLELTNTWDGNFPADILEFSRTSCIEGWNYFIKNRLCSYLKIN